MKVALIYVSLFLIFSILFVLPAIIFPFPAAPKSQLDPLMFVVFLLIDFSCAVYLIERINLSGIKLCLAVALVFWGLQTFMTQIETWYFREAMPAITDGVLLKLFINPLITAVTFIPLGVLMLGKWKQPSNHQHHQLNLKSDWKSVVVVSVTYMIIYFAFGYYIAWQFAEVRSFYSGSTERLGFIEQLRHNIDQDNFLFLFQIFRGFLWILCGLPILLYLKGNRKEKIVACFIVYSVLTSIQLVIDNPFMPAGVRIAHLIEVSTSNALFGILVGFVFSRQMK